MTHRTEYLFTAEEAFEIYCALSQSIKARHTYKEELRDMLIPGAEEMANVAQKQIDSAMALRERFAWSAQQPFNPLD